MSATPGLDGAPAQDSADARAHHIIERADQFVHDGALSVLELCTFLPHTEHEGFLEWLMKGRYHAGGHWDYHAHLREADKNADHQIDLEELVAAVQAWMDDGSPGLSVPHAHAEKSKLSDKEKQRLAFRVEGPPDVILPPPPRKKKSIYEKSLPHKPTMGSTMSRTGFPQMSFEGKTGLRSRGESPLLVRSRFRPPPLMPLHADTTHIRSYPTMTWQSRPQAKPGPPLRMVSLRTWRIGLQLGAGHRLRISKHFPAVPSNFLPLLSPCYGCICLDLSGRSDSSLMATMCIVRRYLQGIGAKPQTPEERW